MSDNYDTSLETSFWVKKEKVWDNTARKGNEKKIVNLKEAYVTPKMLDTTETGTLDH